MSFNADLVVEALDWDLRPHVDAHGTIPEPSDDQVRRMNAALRDNLVKVTGDDFDPNDKAATLKIFGKLSDAQLREMEDANLEAIGIVTGGMPSIDLIQQLPFRVKREFIKWIIRELNDPEG
jgi:hypothetical protein